MTLRLTGVAYRYAGETQPALADVDLEVARGEVVGVVGGNEAGKSTLALVSAGLAPGTIGGRLEGRVLVDDMDTTVARPDQLAAACGALFQNAVTQLSGTARTVWEEVAFGPSNLGLPLEEVVVRVDAALAAVAIQTLAPREPRRLSGGQAQLVALAAVLALRPRFLVLDEPTSQLDPAGTRLVGDALARLVASGSVGLLIVEHKTDLLLRLADRVVALEGGRIVADSPPAELFSGETADRWRVPLPAAVKLGRRLEREPDGPRHAAARKLVANELRRQQATHMTAAGRA